MKPWRMAYLTVTNMNSQKGLEEKQFWSQLDASQVEELLSLVREHCYEQQQGCTYEQDDGHELKHTFLFILTILRLQKLTWSYLSRQPQEFGRSSPGRSQGQLYRRSAAPFLRQTRTFLRNMMMIWTRVSSANYIKCFRQRNADTWFQCLKTWGDAG